MLSPLFTFTSFQQHRLLAAAGQFGRGIESDLYTDSGTDQNALTNIEDLVSRIIGTLTTVAVFFFIIYFILGAFKWVVAGGDSSKVQKARDQMTQAVLGMILMVAAYGIIGLVGGILGIDILQPAAMFGKLVPGGGSSGVGSLIDSARSALGFD